MKNWIDVLLISIAITAVPLCSLAQVSIDSTIPSLLVSSNPISTGVSIGSATAPSQCMQSSAINANFVINTTSYQATYSFRYTCTLTMNGTTQSVVSTNQGGSGSCEPSQSDAACKNAALGDAHKNCSIICASYR